MEPLQMTPSFEAIKELIATRDDLKYLTEDDVQTCAVPLHGGYLKDDIFIDRFGKEEYFEKAQKEGYKYVNRNVISCLRNGTIAKQFVVVGIGNDVFKVYENGMKENNYEDIPDVDKNKKDSSGVDKP